MPLLLVLLFVCHRIGKLNFWFVDDVSFSVFSVGSRFVAINGDGEKINKINESRKMEEVEKKPTKNCSTLKVNK